MLAAAAAAVILFKAPTNAPVLLVRRVTQRICRPHPLSGPPDCFELIRVCAGSKPGCVVEESALLFALFYMTIVLLTAPSITSIFNLMNGAGHTLYKYTLIFNRNISLLCHRCSSSNINVDVGNHCDCYHFLNAENIPF